MKQGHIGWVDLTVRNAVEMRDFYTAVAGWRPEGQDMGGYEDFSMFTPEGDCVAGICHQKGQNSRIPPQWLVYIVIEDLDASVDRALAMGAEMVDDRRTEGNLFCVLQDPAGAAFALFQATEESS